MKNWQIKQNRLNRLVARNAPQVLPCIISPDCSLPLFPRLWESFLLLFSIKISKTEPCPLVPSVCYKLSARSSFFRLHWQKEGTGQTHGGGSKSERLIIYNVPQCFCERMATLVCFNVCFFASFSIPILPTATNHSSRTVFSHRAGTIQLGMNRERNMNGKGEGKGTIKRKWPARKEGLREGQSNLHIAYCYELKRS